MVTADVAPDTPASDQTAMEVVADETPRLDGWDCWGPAGLNNPGYPVGRCPKCKKICQVRSQRALGSVAPASGWQATINHMYKCCPSLPIAVGGAKGHRTRCLIPGCERQFEHRWEHVAHYDEAHSGDAVGDTGHLHFRRSHRFGVGSNTVVSARKAAAGLLMKQLYSAAKAGNSVVSVTSHANCCGTQPSPPA